MGWSFRRSVKLGPFRLNFSRRGVGASVGGPLGRITLRSDGRVTQTTRIPGTGISHQQTLGKASTEASPSTMTPAIGRGAWRAIIVFLGLLFAIVAVRSFGDELAPFAPIAVVGSIGAAIWWVRSKIARSRRLTQLRLQEAAQRTRDEYFASLVESYGEENARLMLIGAPWQGATTAMISEMLGPPVDVGLKVHKALRVEVWKYHQLAKNRFGLRITFENGVCVGWDLATS